MRNIKLREVNLKIQSIISRFHLTVPPETMGMYSLAEEEILTETTSRDTKMR